jgi:hypothetical protein
VTTFEPSATRLVAIDDLGTSQVAVVDKTKMGGRR